VPIFGTTLYVGLLVLIYAPTETSCDDGIVYNSTCYKIHRNERVNWFTAVSRCLANNGTLAVFDDRILSYFASSLLVDGRALWIGLIKSWWTWPDAGTSCSHVGPLLSVLC